MVIAITHPYRSIIWPPAVARQAHPTSSVRTFGPVSTGRQDAGGDGPRMKEAPQAQAAGGLPRGRAYGTGARYGIDLDYCKGWGICAAEGPCGAITMVPEQT
jgi:hypothetical protein